MATMLATLTLLNPAPMVVDMPPRQPVPLHVMAVKAAARERAADDVREWRAEQRRLARERAERRAREAAERAARKAAAQAAETHYGSGAEQWRGLVSAYFPGHVDEALVVIRGESGGDQRADNGTCRGLFQIHECHASKFEQVTGLPYFDGVYDPTANVRFAAYLSGGGTNWSAWSVRP